MKFDYEKIEGEFLPIVPIKLRSSIGFFNFKAFVDSGASYSLFHSDVAQLLGINLEEGERKEIVVGDSDTIIVYVHKILVSLAGKEFEASIGFSKDFTINFYVIGRKTIFEHFLVSFNERKKEIEFKSH
ncbi:TPA: hypothetical protein HA278_01670 [Candidatus Woesearchaeota archaeon]|nr:hypothetical protein [Candidatus Woesearchaeota archaeon]|tara:strand:- start:703 stop:1089 length:387 start_codon:yes stop_codon:yes gene_type:complete